MGKLSQFIQYRTASADPVTVGKTTVTPQAKALLVRFPYGGLVWNRPTAVIVSQQDEEEGETLPIFDVTRFALWGLSGFALATAVLTKLADAK